MRERPALVRVAPDIEDLYRHGVSPSPPILSILFVLALAEAAVPGEAAIRFWRQTDARESPLMPEPILWAQWKLQVQ
jgi:hypothetical protein